jgi:hypothetical protein
MTKKPSRRVQVLRLGLASSFLVGVCALFAGACGGAAETTLHFGGESHFLRHCSDRCDDGLNCISGVCTRGCIVDQANACATFSGASCTSDSFEPGAVAVCDVKCSTDANCRALGGDYTCDVGFCRAPELVAGLGGAAGAGGMAAAAGSGDAAGSGETAVAPLPEPAGPLPFSIPPTSTPAPAPQSPPPPVEPPRPDVPAAAVVVPVPAGCPFEYLGDWIACENAGWPNVVKTDATDVEGCMRACLEREDCTAVTDYFWLGRPDLGCWLYVSSCDAPSGGPWQEEDGGRNYRKACGAR